MFWFTECGMAQKDATIGMVAWVGISWAKWYFGFLSELNGHNGDGRSEFGLLGSCDSGNDALTEDNGDSGSKSIGLIKDSGHSWLELINLARDSGDG